MRKQAWMFILPLLTVTGSSWGDTIRVSDKVYDDVIVREGASLYYVQTPSDGKVFTVPKSEIDASSVSVTKDPEKRKALVVQWNSHHETTVTEISAPSFIKLPVSESSSTSDSRTTDTESPKGSVKLKDYVKAELRSRNLDYVVEEGVLVVGAPAMIRGIRGYSTGRLVTRTYKLGSLGSETMPKVVLQNPTSSGVSTGMQSGGGMNSGAQFSNISQLFSTIDDRLVGETPPVLGSLGVVGSRR